jgi:phosphoribosylanthranilate isomerase
MAPLIIKICGLSTPETVAAALDAGADAIGLVRFDKSPRHVSLGRAAELAALARGRAEIALLMVDPSDAELAEAVEAIEPDLVQLHGEEPPHRVAVIRARAERPVMKAVGVRTAEDVATARRTLEVADRLLLDAKPPPGATRPGGNAAAFDWGLVADLDPPLSFMLSGGLTPETVAEAVRRVRPAGVDVSSGVERAPGEKDPERIRAFIAAARAAAEELRDSP